ncbi:PDZ domain-containing protein [Bacillus piscicola]|uniref:YlbL family protein n=1 Tax=Bacillus piscicola TaxID=1632684 RepID=UPI001F090FD8|nr:PDZ domain-containing protein [Bacillus piscicola]
MNDRIRKGTPRRWTALIVLAVLLVVTQIPLPYYYSQPGDAAPLGEMISVDSGNGEVGEFYLTTIRQRRATIPLFIWAKFSSYREVVPTDAFLLEDETDEEYFHRQTMLMDSAQEAAKITAYEAAGFPFDVKFQGIRVTQVIEGMDAANHLKEGDLITKLRGEPITTLEELNSLLADEKAGEEVELTIKRDGATKDVVVEMDTFPAEMGQYDKVGLGLLYPFTQRDVTFDPEVTIDAGAIGGPSAGLMFSLEIYNQLIEKDLTGGLDVAGTGTIDEDGNVGRIGGIDKKIVAAHKAGVDVFFAPDDDLATPSNYQIAVKTAEELGTDMVVIPVKEFNDAVSYLENRLKEKTAVQEDSLELAAFSFRL